MSADSGLQALAVTAQQLQQVSLNCPTSADHPTLPQGQAVTDNSVVGLLKTKDWVEAQVMGYKTELSAAKFNPVDTDDPIKAANIVRKLQDKLLLETAEHDKKELMITRLQLGRALQEHLFPEGAADTSGGGDAPTEPTQRGRTLEDLANKQSSLVSEIMKNHRTVESMRANLESIKKKNFELKRDNRELMTSIKDKNALLEDKLQDFSKDQEKQRLCETLDMLVKKIDIQRHTFQGLVLGSGINWAQDPEMEKLVLSLGAPLDV